jgi:acyl carrier protein
MKPILIDVMSKVFSVPKESLSGDSSMESIENWDSLTHLELVTSIEDAFNVKIDVSDIINMTSISSIMKILEDKGV